MKTASVVINKGLVFDGLLFATHEQLGCILRRHPDLEASSSARQRRLGKDRRLSVQTSFSALHEPAQQSSIWSGISSIRQKASCITRTRKRRGPHPRITFMAPWYVRS